MAQDPTPAAIPRPALPPGLLDIRLPAEAAGGMLAEVLAAAGIGLLLALLLTAVLAPLTRRAARQRPATLADRLAALAPLPDAERALALLHLLAIRDPDAAAGFRADLYAPGRFPDAAKIEAALLAAEAARA